MKTRRSSQPLKIQRTALQEDSFFSRKHLFQAAWAILIAAVIGFGGYLIGIARTTVTGQEKVVIATPDDGAAPLVVRVETREDDPQQRYVETLEVISEEFQKLRLLEAERQANQNNITQQKSTGMLRFNRPTIPAFETPSAVKGYLRASLAGYAQASCPPTNFTNADVLIIEMHLNPTINIAALTPAFIRVDSPEPDGNVSQVFEQQFNLRAERNTFGIPIDLEPGSYHIEAGFYLRSELVRAFPDFHSIRCPITVTK